MRNLIALRKVWVKEHSSLKDLLFNNFVYYRTKIINKMGEHLKIIEYPAAKTIWEIVRKWAKLPNSGESPKAFDTKQDTKMS